MSSLSDAIAPLHAEIDPSYLLSREFPEVTQEYTAHDWMLYGLGIGAGQDFTHPYDLRHTTERGFPFPSFGGVLAHPGAWMSEPDTGIDWGKVLHVGQSMRTYATLPTQAWVRARTRVVSVVDKGPATGVLVTFTRTLVNVENGQPLADITSTAMCRANGGCGTAVDDSAPTVEPGAPIPSSPPDASTEIEVNPNSALLYRLSGDMNPIHAFPDAAESAGMSQPILHGLATFGLALFHVFKTRQLEGGSGTEVGCRFTGTVLPGESLTIESWDHGNGFVFRVRALEREATVIDRGYMRQGVER